MKTIVIALAKNVTVVLEASSGLPPGSSEMPPSPLWLPRRIFSGVAARLTGCWPYACSISACSRHKCSTRTAQGIIEGAVLLDSYREYDQASLPGAKGAQVVFTVPPGPLDDKDFIDVLWFRDAQTKSILAAQDFKRTNQIINGKKAG